MQLVYAYTDESGNTGNNIFDQAQPVFWTGTILSKNYLNEVDKTAIEECKRLLGVVELHGNELGLAGIEKIANIILEFIHDNDLHFIFSYIEKEHVANMKLVDTLIDSGLNKAVSPIYHYH